MEQDNFDLSIWNVFHFSPEAFLKYDGKSFTFLLKKSSTKFKHLIHKYIKSINNCELPDFAIMYSAVTWVHWQNSSLVSQTFLAFILYYIVDFCFRVLCFFSFSGSTSYTSLQGPFSIS